MLKQRFRLEEGRIIYIDEKTFRDREERMMMEATLIRCKICGEYLLEKFWHKHLQECHPDLWQTLTSTGNGKGDVEQKPPSTSVRSTDASASSDYTDYSNTVEKTVLVDKFNTLPPENMICEEHPQALLLSESKTEEPEKDNMPEQSRSEMIPESIIDTEIPCPNDEDYFFKDEKSESFLSNARADTIIPKHEEESNQPMLLTFYNDLIKSDLDDESFNTFNYGCMPTLEKEISSDSDSDSESSMDDSSSSSEDDSTKSEEDKEATVESHSVHYSSLNHHQPAQQSAERLLWCKLCDNYYSGINELKMHVRDYHKLDDRFVTRWNYATWDLEIARVWPLPTENEF